MKYFIAIAQTLLAASFASYRELSAFTGEFVSALVLVVLLTILAIGLKAAPALIARALPGHRFSDLVRTDLIARSDLPLWLLILFLIYDVAAAIYVAWRLERSARPAHASVDLGRQALEQTQ